MNINSDLEMSKARHLLDMVEIYGYMPALTNGTRPHLTSDQIFLLTSEYPKFNSSDLERIFNVTMEKSNDKI